jgi:hypothetical protein
MACTNKPPVERIEIFKTNSDNLGLKVERLIYLEDCSDSCLIGDIGQLEIFRDKIYILDCQEPTTFYVFDTSGNFIAHTNKAKGPNEHLLIHSFIIDSSNNQGAFLMIFGLRNVYFADLQGLIYNERHFLDSYLSVKNAVRLDTTRYLINMQLPSLKSKALEQKPGTRLKTVVYTILDNNFENETYTFFNRENGDPRSSYHLFKPFSVFDDSLLCLVPLDNNIYRFENNQMLPRYYVDFGKYEFTEKDIARGLPFVFNDKAGLLDNLIETKDYLSFSFAFRSKINYCIYDKFGMQVGLFDNMLINNNLPELLPINSFCNNIVCVFNNSEMENAMKLLDPTHSFNSRNTHNPIIVILSINHLKRL